MASTTPVIAWTRNAVSVAEPSVWNQFESDGTLRKRKYLVAPTRPERSSSQSRGMFTSATILSVRRLFLRDGGGTSGISGDPAAGWGRASPRARLHAHPAPGARRP